MRGLMIVVMGMALAGQASAQDAPKHELKVKSDPPGMVVSFDGESCTTPCTLHVTEGKPVRLAVSHPSSLVILSKTDAHWVDARIFSGHKWNLDTDTVHIVLGSR